MNLVDVPGFIKALNAMEYQVEAAANCDGELNLLDASQFIRLLSGAGLLVTDPSIEDPPQDGRLGDINVDGFIDLLDGEC